MTALHEADFVPIAVLENAIEAQLLSSLLQQYGIPHRLRSHHDTAYDGLFQLQKGWGEIYGPAERRLQILEFLSDIRAHPPGMRDQSPDGD